jgi:osmoprotectant transport system ATP-binding protein
VAENVATVPHLLHWPKKKVDQRLDYLFRMAGLDPVVYKHRLPSQLSGGQQQRIGVLRGLAADPEVVLMDEPFGALDPITKGKLQGELIDLQEKVHKTIIFVTHDIDEALKLADRILLMRRGKIEQLGTPEELQNNPKNPFVRDFIGEDRLSQLSPEGSVETMLEDAPLTVHPDRPPREVLELMAEHSRETAQVVRRNGSWAGMVFLGDVRRGMRGGMAQVSDVAKKDRALYLPEATIRDAAELLVDMEAPVPVISESGKLTGLVTNASLARLAINRLTRGGGSN